MSDPRVPAQAASSAGAAIMARLDALAAFTSDPDGLTRLYLTPEHKAATQQVMAWMEEAGLTPSIDAVGTVVGRHAGPPGARTLILGSHIDTVRDAGRYDGALGVVTAIQAMAELRARGIELPFAVEVVAFGDEEGVRFPVTLSGSRALAGRFDPAGLAAIDEDEMTLADALLAFGCDPAGIGAIARRPETVMGYVEVHIEQGPVLEAENLPVGIVTAISGATRLLVEVTGRAGHAGTVPMHFRRDAFTAAAEMALAVEQTAEGESSVVATVGRVEVKPGAVNVIPGLVRFSVDIRSPDDAARAAAVDTVRQGFAAIAKRRRMTLKVEATYEASAASCAPWLQEALSRAIVDRGVRPIRLPSGAGHDGLAMKTLCPIGMLFVRCAGGISHHPTESITAADAGVAVDVLVQFLLNLQDVRPA